MNAGRRMRVAIDARKIGDYGIGTYIAGLLRGWLELGADDHLIALAPEGAAIPEGVEHVVVDAPHYSVRELLLAGRAAERAGADVFHAPHYVTPFTRLPLVVTIHDLIHLHQPMRNPLAPLYARTMIGRAVRNAARVLTVSEAVKRDLVAFGCDERKIAVTYNGVGSLRPGARPAAKRAAFLYVGNDKPHKNVETLVEAFAVVRRARPELALVLAGAEFARFRGREGIERRGFVSDAELGTLYFESLALVLPSHEEGFGLPAAEAMLHGTAVIASLAPALVEITGGAALHADARDAGALASAMLRVASDDALRGQLETRGTLRAAAFTWRKCAAATREAWLEAWNIVERRV